MSDWDRNIGVHTPRKFNVILDVCEEWEIEPLEISQSNWNEIMFTAYNLVDRGEKVLLELLLEKASSSANRELRVYLRGDRRDLVPVKEVNVGLARVLVVEYTPEQFRKVKNATRGWADYRGGP